MHSASLFGYFLLTDTSAFTAVLYTKSRRSYRYHSEIPSPIVCILSSVPEIQQTQFTTTTDNDNGMNKLETASVKRFTIGYDKLCKNCPTRLQPRVDTLTEMILGLDDKEREELMSKVSKRLLDAQLQQNGDDDRRKVTSSKDVYDFQTAGEDIVLKKQKLEKEKRTHAKEEVSDNCRITKKMIKARGKLESNKQSAMRASRLLEVTIMLLSRRDTDVKVSCADNGWYHEIDRLKQLPRAELRMEKLKLVAIKAKHDQKIAKQRLKLYDASMALKNKRRGALEDTKAMSEVI